jgi:hypothetical protein
LKHNILGDYWRRQSQAQKYTRFHARFLQICEQFSGGWSDTVEKRMANRSIQTLPMPSFLFIPRPRPTLCGYTP